MCWPALSVYCYFSLNCHAFFVHTIAMFDLWWCGNFFCHVSMMNCRVLCVSCVFWCVVQVMFFGEGRCCVASFHLFFDKVRCNVLSCHVLCCGMMRYSAVLCHDLWWSVLHCQTKPCGAVSCRVTSCSVMQCWMLCPVMCGGAVQGRAMSCFVVLCNVMPCPVLYCCAVSCRVMCCGAVRCSVVPCHVL